MCTADFAVIAVLFRFLAFRTGSFDESVGEERFRFGIVKLFDFSFFDDVGFAHCRPDFFAEGAVFGGVRGTVVREFDVEAAEIVEMGGVHLGDEFFFGDAFGTSAEHNCCSVSIVGADIDAVVAA